jgi:hypothetical protein
MKSADQSNTTNNTKKKLRETHVIIKLEKGGKK